MRRTGTHQTQGFFRHRPRHSSRQIFIHSLASFKTISDETGGSSELLDVNSTDVSEFLTDLVATRILTTVAVDPVQVEALLRSYNSREWKTHRAAHKSRKSVQTRRTIPQQLSIRTHPLPSPLQQIPKCTPHYTHNTMHMHGYIHWSKSTPGNFRTEAVAL